MARKALATYREKMAQTNREARATVVALGGSRGGVARRRVRLAGVDVQVLGTPLWIVVGCVGTWAGGRSWPQWC